MTTIGTKDAAEALWEQAIEICNLTHFWQPDCTLALMHSAIGPLIAAEELWQQTFAQPYPNVVKTNLGREKIKRYNAIPRPSGFAWFMGDQEDTLGIGHFMAWVSFQENWVRQLKVQIEAVIGAETPEKILVVDDLHMEGGTRLLVRSLLKHLYPQARVIFSTHRVSSSWKDLGERWLETHFPQLSKIDDPKKKRFLSHAVYQFSPGTTDTAKEDLGWRETTAKDAILEPLLPFGPAELWFQYPKYIQQEIRKIIHKRASTYHPTEPTHPAWPQRGILTETDVEHFILCDIWLRNSVSAEEIIDNYALPASLVHEALQLLLTIFGFASLIRFQENGTTRYTVNVRGWMEMLQKNITDFEQYLDFSKLTMERFHEPGR